MTDSPHNDALPFPKPAKRAKNRKAINRVRPAGKRRYTTEQRQRRREQDMLYRKYTRPQHFLDTAREQGRLRRSDDDIPGDTPQEKLAHLTPEERPLCEMRLEPTDCDARPRLGTSIHHLQGRGHLQRRDNGELPLLNDRSKFAIGCDECHDYVEQHRAWAYEHGWLIKRNGKETTAT